MLGGSVVSVQVCLPQLCGVGYKLGLEAPPRLLTTEHDCDAVITSYPHLREKENSLYISYPHLKEKENSLYI